MVLFNFTSIFLIKVANKEKLKDHLNIYKVKLLTNDLMTTYPFIMNI